MTSHHGCNKKYCCDFFIIWITKASLISYLCRLESCCTFRFFISIVGKYEIFVWHYFGRFLMAVKCHFNIWSCHNHSFSAGKICTRYACHCFFSSILFLICCISFPLGIFALHWLQVKSICRIHFQVILIFLEVLSFNLNAPSTTTSYVLLWVAFSECYFLF